MDLILKSLTKWCLKLKQTNKFDIKRKIWAPLIWIECLWPVTIFSIWWSTTAVSVIAIPPVEHFQTLWKRLDVENVLTQQIFSMGLRWCEYAGHSNPFALQVVIDDGSLWRLSFSSIKTKAGQTAAAHNLIVGSRLGLYPYTSHSTSFKGVQAGAVSQRNPCPQHDASISECVIFWSRLHVPSFLYILTRLSSGSRTNLDSSVDIKLPQSNTVKLTCCWRQFNCDPCDFTDKRTQTQGTLAYSPLIYLLICLLHTHRDRYFTNGHCSHKWHTCGGRSSIPLGDSSNIWIFHGVRDPWTIGHRSSFKCLVC